MDCRHSLSFQKFRNYGYLIGAILLFPRKKCWQEEAMLETICLIASGPTVTFFYSEKNYWITNNTISVKLHLPKSLFEWISSLENTLCQQTFSRWSLLHTWELVTVCRKNLETRSSEIHLQHEKHCFMDWLVNISCKTKVV